MQLKTKTLWTAISVIAILFVASCSPGAGAAETEAAATATSSQQILKTTMGDFVIASARLVDEVHDSQAPSGEKFLLIGLVDSTMKKLVPGEFSLEDFQTVIQKNQSDIYVLGESGSQTYYTQMGGWVEDDFVIGFRVPIEESYTLYWPGNAPIPLNTVK
jgi:hypothetical protein